MFKIMQYSFFDLMRSRWSYSYFGFFFLFTSALLWLSGDIAKVVISLLNVILILCPLIATMFGVMYYYNSREFTELLLAQPVKRIAIFWGQFLGLGFSLSLSLLLGIGIPFLAYGLLASMEIWHFSILLFNGVVLSFIFAGLSFLIALRYENRIRGFGLAILVWLFFAVLYDGFFLLLVMHFREYPLEKVALAATLLNPIDLSRILVLLQLDVSALMGYTGAVLQRFFGSGLGSILTLTSLVVWTTLPLLAIRWVAERKDF
ncbi:MAG: ABC transporter permease [Lewinellaceae bacterium]|nr:ABC transporter permease [Lewinellaceae bacterium]